MINFTREINRLMLALFAAFSLVLIAATYYSIVGRAALLDREDNPRLVEAERSIKRGSIYDRDGTLLAQTTANADDFSIRQYVHPSTYSALGYYSYRYGTGGVESAFDERLSGAAIPETFEQLVLAQPREGEDIRLTLDLTVQQRVVDAMDGRQGAAIVTTVPGGDVLALVSLPTFNPNTLDTNWDDLVNDPGNPFFNRVLQGRYQPGTIIQIPVTIDAITRGQSLNAQFPSGGVPVQLDDLTLNCVLSPSQVEMTLADAFVYGCPAPFSQIMPVINAEQLEDTFQTFRLVNPPTLDNLVTDDVQRQRPVNLSRLNLRENILGQGDLSISPIAIHNLTAAITNGGNAPQPHIVSAVRLPGTEAWAPYQLEQPSIPYTTEQTAAEIARLLQRAAENGTASLTDWNMESVGGQAAIAYSGEGAIVWFTGFVLLEGVPDVVVTVVLENTTDPAEAVEVGKQALSAAQFALINGAGS